MKTEKRIDRRRNYILVVDIETANDVTQGIAYDIGLAVADKKGNIYEERSYVIQEMFEDYPDLLHTAYYGEKLATYLVDVAQQRRRMVDILTAYHEINELITKYNISDLYAYNAKFDYNGLNRTIRYLTKSKIRWFFPYGIKVHCIWNMACQVIVPTKSYYRFVLDNNFVSEKGNARTNAEAVYSFLSSNPDFEEAHTGLEDVEIELKILVACYKKHKKMDTAPKFNCWQAPQKKFKEFCKNA